MKKYWLLILISAFVIIGAVVMIADISNKRQECYKVQDQYVCDEMYG